MRCKHHTSTELELSEVVTTRTVPWSDEVTRVYHDVKYCPDCFEEYEQGATWKNDIENKPIFKNITASIDRVIDAAIDERK